MKKTFCIFCFVITSFCYSQTEDKYPWKYVGQFEDNVDILIKPIDLQKDEMWVKLVVKSSKDYNGGITVFRTVIHCDKFTYDLGESYTFNSEGEQLTKDESTSSNNAVKLGSFMEIAFKFYCQHR